MLGTTVSQHCGVDTCLVTHASKGGSRDRQGSAPRYDLLERTCYWVICAAVRNIKNPCYFDVTRAGRISTALKGKF